MSQATPTGTEGRFKVNAVLYLAVIVLAGACVVGTVLWGQRHQDRVEVEEQGREYAAVLAAASSEAKAFINIDYRDMDKSIEAVSEGATGQFKEQYSVGNAGLRQIMTDNRSIMKGKVLRAGVGSLGEDEAWVFLGTSGTVQNTSTRNQPIAREFRLKLVLQKVKGRWLTSDIQFLDGQVPAGAVEQE